MSVTRIPDLTGGNVLRKHITVELSIRIPPLIDTKKAAKILTDKLTVKPLPFNVNVGNITPRNAHANPPPFSPLLIASRW